MRSSKTVREMGAFCQGTRGKLQGCGLYGVFSLSEPVKTLDQSLVFVDSANGQDKENRD
jgi:hypothetical protein